MFVLSLGDLTGIIHCGFNSTLLLTNAVEYLFMCLFTIQTPSLVQCLFRSLAHFHIGLFVHLLLSFENPLYVLNTSLFQECDVQIFSPTLWFVLSFV